MPWQRCDAFGVSPFAITHHARNEIITCAPHLRRPLPLTAARRSDHRTSMPRPCPSRRVVGHITATMAMPAASAAWTTSSRHHEGATGLGRATRAPTPRYLDVVIGPRTSIVVLAGLLTLTPPHRAAARRRPIARSVPSRPSTGITVRR